MLAGVADELITIARVELDDEITDLGGSDAVSLWKTTELYNYLTEACDAVAKGTLGLFKTVTLPFTAGQQDLSLPRYVLHVREARVVGGGPLKQQNANRISDDFGGFLCASNNGTPRQFVRDMLKRGIRLYPVPASDGALELQCSVTIGAPIQAGSMLPFDDTEDQRLLIEYVKFRAYSKPEADTEDPARARAAKDFFDQGVASRRQSLQNMRRAPGTIRMEYL
jgi:hypothetical protein